MGGQGMGGQGGQQEGGPHGQPIVGPQVNTFDPQTDGSEHKYKGGSMNGQNDTICKMRYQQISVTALGNLTDTTTARLLQASGTNTTATTYYTM